MDVGLANFEMTAVGWIMLFFLFVIILLCLCSSPCQKKRYFLQHDVSRMAIEHHNFNGRHSADIESMDSGNVRTWIYMSATGEPVIPFRVPTGLGGDSYWEHVDLQHQNHPQGRRDDIFGMAPSPVPPPTYESLFGKCPPPYSDESKNAD